MRVCFVVFWLCVCSYFDKIEEDINSGAFWTDLHNNFHSGYDVLVVGRDGTYRTFLSAANTLWDVLAPRPESVKRIEEWYEGRHPHKDFE